MTFLPPKNVWVFNVCLPLLALPHKYMNWFMRSKEILKRTVEKVSILGWEKAVKDRQKLKGERDFNNEVDLICDKNKIHNHTLTAKYD